MIWLCIDPRNRFRVYLVLWCGCGRFIGSDGEDDPKDPTCMGVVLDLKCISTQARCEIRCPLSRRSHRALVLDLSVAATKAPWASPQPHLMKGCTTEEDAKHLIDLICVMDLIRALLVSALQLLEAHRWLGRMQSSCNHTLKTS